MKTCSISAATKLAKDAIAATTSRDAAKPDSEPLQQRASAVGRNLRFRFAPETRKGLLWIAALAVVGLLLAGVLAPALINHHTVLGVCRTWDEAEVGVQW